MSAEFFCTTLNLTNRNKVIITTKKKLCETKFAPLLNALIDAQSKNGKLRKCTSLIISSVNFNIKIL